MVRLLPTDEPSLLLPLSDLVPLQPHIPGGAVAMRPLDPSHVQQLVVSQMDDWPPILVTHTDVGYLVIDGYHRWQAARLKHAPTIKACCQPCADERAVINAAFRANLAHGLKATTSIRGDYAFWLHTTFPALHQDQIAQLTGLTQGAVSKALAKRKRAVQPHEAERSASQRSSPHRATRRFLREALRFLSETEALPDEELFHLLTPTDRARLMRLATLLGQPSPTTAGQMPRPVTPPRPYNDIPEEYGPNHHAVWGSVPR
jgi:predicted transcriptional regulator